MSKVNRPEWLPVGWTMEVRTRRTGVIDRYYTCPLSGSTFRSKPEVMRYLNIKKFDGHASESAPHGGDNMQLLAAQVDNPLERLPTGWIPKSRTRMNSVSAGNNYKVRAQIDYSPSGLPPGWITVIKFRKADRNYRIRKDPYYIEPVNGYAFRSKKDVFRYIETGEVRRYAFRLKERLTPDACSLKKESLPPITAQRSKVKRTAVRRRLFSRQTPKSNVRMEAVIAGPPPNPPSPHLGYVSVQSGEDGSEASCLTPASAEQLEQINGKFQIESQPNPAIHVEEIPGQPAIIRFPESVSEKLSKPSMLVEGEKLLVPDASSLEEKQFELIKTQDRPKKCGRGQPPGSSKAEAIKSVSGQPGPSKTKAMKAITMPLRASKRLAGIKADPVTDFRIGDWPRRAKTRRSDEPQPTLAKDSHPSCGSHQRAMPMIDVEHQKKLESKEPHVEQAAQVQQVDPLTMLPFGDTWPDPCIEFAFKTLTGDFPVLADSAAIEDYFHQQLISSQNPSSSGGPASLAFGGTLSLSRDDVRPCSLENGKVNKECHPKTGLKH